MNVEASRGSGPGSPAALKQANTDRLIDAVREGGAVSQAGLARSTGLAPSTVSNLVRELVDAGVLEVGVAERSDGSGSGTRRVVRLAAMPGNVAAVDLGRFHLAVAIADITGRVLAERRQTTPGGWSLETSLGQSRALIDELLVEAGVDHADVLRGVVALPSPIDRRTGRAGSASILPAWVGVDPDEVCEQAFGFPTSVQNDSNLGALGEATWGAAHGVDDMVYVWVSEGVGCGLVVGGRPHAGVGGVAGELGHTLQRSDYGDLCRCGSRGCLETLVSTRAIVRLLEPRTGPLSGFGEVVARAEGGDHLCRRVLSETGRHIGVAVANVINLLDPQRIVVGGEIALAGDLVLDPLRDAVHHYAIPSAAETVEIVPTALGERAELLGAVAAAIRTVAYTG